MFTILHISDLHRSKEEPIDNQTLLASLLADQDRYAGENPRIPHLRQLSLAVTLFEDHRSASQIGNNASEISTRSQVTF